MCILEKPSSSKCERRNRNTRGMKRIAAMAVTQARTEGLSEWGRRQDNAKEMKQNFFTEFKKVSVQLSKGNEWGNMYKMYMVFYKMKK